MDDVTTLAAAPAFDSMRTRLIQAVVLTYQAAASLTFAAVPFVADTWLSGAYLIGIIYLGVGLWVFRLRSSEPAGIGFAFFTASSAISLAAGSAIASNAGVFLIWAFALGLTGGSLLHLAMVFSDTWEVALQYRFVVWSGYVAGLIPGFFALVNLSAYPGIEAVNLIWKVGVGFIGVSLVAFLGATTAMRLRSPSPIIQEQSRFILWTALVSFAPASLWILLNASNMLPFEMPAIVGIAPTILFPIGLAFTLLRYQVVETDFVLSQAGLYAVMTVLAGAAYALLASGLSIIFGNLINASSPFVIGVRAFIFVLALSPMRVRLQRLTDRIFYKGEDIFLEQVRAYSLRIANSEGLAEIGIALFQEIEQAFEPMRVHVFVHDSWTNYYTALPNSAGEKTTDLRFPADSGLVNTLKKVKSSIYLNIGQTFPRSLQSDKARISLLGAQLYVAMPGLEGLAGWIALGPRKNGAQYFKQDLNYLSELSEITGMAVERAQILSDKERREHEMNVITRVAQGVTVTVAFDDILELIYTQTGQLLPSGDFNISLYNPATKILRHAFYVEHGERLSDRENRDTNPNQGLEIEVVKSRRAILTEHYVQTCRDYGVVPAREGILSWMGVPLNAGAETIGVISIGSGDAATIYTGEQENLLQAIADQAAGAIVKARLLEESEGRARQLATLNEVARSLTSTLEIDPLLNRILQSATSILNCEAGSLFLVDEETDELVFEVTVGPVADDLIGMRLEHGVGLVGQSVTSREPVIVNDVEKSKSWSDKADKETGFITRDLLVVPMMVKDRVIGVIEVINKRDRSPFDVEDQEMLIAFTGQAAILVENARLYAQTDQKLASRVEELSVMQRIDRELNTSLDVERAMEITLDWSMRQSDSTAGLVGVVEESGLQIMASEGFASQLEAFKEEPLPLTHAAIREAVTTAKVQRISGEDLQNGASLLGKAESQMVIPIRRESEVIGLVVLESENADTYSEEIEEFLVRLSDHAAIAISNAQLYNEVQQANLAKSEFVSFVAHELKTPMTSIKGYADLLAAGSVGEINEAQDNFLATIRTNVTRMSTLVTDLADISRIEAGRLHFEFSTIPIKVSVEDVAHSTKALLDEKNQTMVIDIPDDLRPAWGDPDRIIQVLTNLVSNAHKYTPEGGKITIYAREADNEWDPEGAAKVVHISVEDTGIGIKEEDQKKIFQQYFRTEEGKDVAAGTGLGLNIARYLVEMQGGTIWFESEYRKGTTFHFTVPITELESE